MANIPVALCLLAVILSGFCTGSIDGFSHVHFISQRYEQGRLNCHKIKGTKKSRGQKNQGEKIKGTGTSIADGNSKKIKGTGTSIADGNSSNREFIPGYCHRKKFRISAPLIGKVHF